MFEPVINFVTVTKDSMSIYYSTVHKFIHNLFNHALHLKVKIVFSQEKYNRGICLVLTIMKPFTFENYWLGTSKKIQKLLN